MVTKKVLDELYSCTCGDCKNLTITLSNGEGTDPKLLKEAERIAKGIYDGSIKSGTIDKKLTKAVAQKLFEAVRDGFGKDLSEVDYDSPDHNMIASLEKNVYHFSAAKDYHQIKAISSVLKDGDGKVRSFADFKNEALKVSEEFLGKNLRTEYDTAVASSQMAAKWLEFEKNKDTLGMLRYRTAGDSRVRPAHKVLDNVTREVDDSFWDYYYPPNGWNCRCDVIATGSGRRTDKIELPEDKDVPQMFRTNMAKAGVAFPPDHPYYVGLPDAILKQAEVLLPPAYRWKTLQKYENGGIVRENELVDQNAPDYHSVKSIALDKAAKGMKVDIMPVINIDDREIRIKLLPGVKGNSNPDLKINGMLCDVKTPTLPLKDTNIHNRLDKGIKQVDYVIVELKALYDVKRLKQIAQGKFMNKNHKTLKVIEFKVKGKYYRYTRNKK